jgi:selenocysteine lyase/cysteine desulfurase
VPSPAPVLPAKGDFAIPEGVTYTNSAFTHPMPVAAAQAARRYVDLRSQTGLVLKQVQNVDVKAEFAALINVKPSEISFIPNTSTGENLIVNGLGITHTDRNVVTDALHFEGDCCTWENCRSATDSTYASCSLATGELTSTIYMATQNRCGRPL